MKEELLEALEPTQEVSGRRVELQQMHSALCDLSWKRPDGERLL